MLDWPTILTTDDALGVPTFPFRATDTGVIGYGHQNPESFASEVTRYWQISLGEAYDEVIHAVTANQVQHLYVMESGEWLEECEERTPDAMPVTLTGSLS